MPSKSDLDKLISDKVPMDQIVDILHLFKPTELALLMATSKPESEIEKILKSEQLETLWANRFNELSLERDTSFQFIDTKQPLYRANFYCGYILYLSALKAKREASKMQEEVDILLKNKSSVEISALNKSTPIQELKSTIDNLKGLYHTYLSFAIKKFHSFHANTTLFTSLIIECHTDVKKEQLDQLYTRLIYGAPHISQEKTPSSLLFATTFFYLAGFYQKIDRSDESIACYKKCWEYLCIAKLLESSSSIEIHNAYFGEGLRLSNAYGIDSIKELQERCLSIADKVLPKRTQDTIETEVRSMLRDGCKIEDLELDSKTNFRAIR